VLEDGEELGAEGEVGAWKVRERDVEGICL